MSGTCTMAYNSSESSHSRTQSPTARTTIGVPAKQHAACSVSPRPSGHLAAIRERRTRTRRQATSPRKHILQSWHHDQRIHTARRPPQIHHRPNIQPRNKPSTASHNPTGQSASTNTTSGTTHCITRTLSNQRGEKAE